MNTEQELEKKLSPLNVWALAFGCVIGWGAFVMPGDTFLRNAGPLGTLIAMSIAAIIMMILSVNYSFMVNRYPKAGGSFIYAGHAFGPRHAYVCAWFLSLSYIAIVPLNATALALIGRNLMGGVFQVGYLYTVAGYDIYLGEILLAESALLLFAFLSIHGVKTAGNFQTLLAVMLAAGILTLLASAFLSPKARMSHLLPLFPEGKPVLPGLFAVLAVAPWAFSGFDTIPQAAEEFSFSAKKTMFLMGLTCVMGALAYILLSVLTVSVLPGGYTDWQGYICSSPSLKGLESLPTFYAAHELMGNAGILIIGLAVLSAILSGIVGFYMAGSRLLYAMAEAKTIPSWFGTLSHTSHTPYHAIIFIMAISFIAPFFGRTALGWIVDMSSLGAAIGYAYTSSAVIRFALKEGKAGYVVTGILGVFFAAVFVIILLVPIPGLGCSLGKESWICLGAWVLLGLLFWLKSKKRA